MPGHIKDASPLLASLGAIGLVAVGAGAIFLATQVYTLKGELALEAARTASTTAEFTQKLVVLSDTLYAAQQNLEAVQDRLGGFEHTVGGISDTVGDLEKLSKIDPELLQKYSKVYFLNENYIPKNLRQIPQQYVYSETKTEQVVGQIEPNVVDMIKDAKDDDIELFVASAFRSFAQQKALKSSYTVTYGVGANAFSAEQGYSEHQLGTTVDFTTTGLGGGLDGFNNTAAYQWLLKNAYKYGFVLSYPAGNGYYMFEPWHWRFVGEKLARDLNRQGKNFYQMEQRDIDEYLINFFD